MELDFEIMGRAEDIFERIKKDGIAAIDDFISTRKSEELFLDFKRSSNNGAGKFLDQKDRNNLAEAISGFGNSEGGVIIWGIDCSKDVDYADVARAKFPIENVKRFVSWLENAVSGCTVPPHSGVLHYPIVINDKEDGFAVTYIPKSDHAPHQVVGELKYYMRAGSSFSAVPHGVLAGMFGRMPQPHIFHMFSSPPAKIINEKIEITLGFLIRNEGPGIASDLFMNAMVISTPGENCTLAFKQPDPSYWVAHFSFWRHISAITRFEYRVPPESWVKPFEMNIIIAPPFSERLEIEGICGCSQSPPIKFKIENSNKIIEKLYNDFLEKNNKGLLTEKDRQNFIDEVLNIKDVKRDKKL
jgi:hypothetical protein